MNENKTYISGSTIMGVFGLLLSFLGITFGKYIFLVIFVLGIIHYNKKKEIYTFIYSNKKDTIYSILESIYIGANDAYNNTRIEKIEIHQEPQKNTIKPYWYLSQYEIKDICGISDKSSAVSQWKNICDNSSYIHSLPYLSGNDSPNKKLHYSIEAIKNIYDETNNDYLLDILNGNVKFTYWYKLDNSWQFGSYSPII